jgi:hypothetical protein
MHDSKLSELTFPKWNAIGGNYYWHANFTKKSFDIKTAIRHVLLNVHGAAFFNL